jgi:hypothetical protein
MGLSPTEAKLTHSKAGVLLDDGALRIKVRR